MHDFRTVLQSCYDHYDELGFSKDEKQLKKLFKRFVDKTKHWEEKLYEKKNADYLPYPYTQKKYSKFGLVGDDFKIKAQNMQDNRDRIIFQHRVLNNVFENEAITKDLFFNPVLTEEGTDNYDYEYLASIERERKESRKSVKTKIINFIMKGTTIIKSILGFLGAGESFNELLDLIDAIINDE